MGHADPERRGGIEVGGGCRLLFGEGGREEGEEEEEGEEGGGEVHFFGGLGWGKVLVGGREGGSGGGFRGVKRRNEKKPKKRVDSKRAQRRKKKTKILFDREVSLETAARSATAQNAQDRDDLERRPWERRLLGECGRNGHENGSKLRGKEEDRAKTSWAKKKVVKR